MKAERKLILLLAAISQLTQAAFVMIGDPGNAPDSNGYGKVDYVYQIAVKEVTITEFAASGAGDGDEAYWNESGRGGGPTAPAVNVSWYEAAKYCNWLTTGDIYQGAYQFNESGMLTNVLSRAEILESGDLFYVLPTENEWHKAAYYTGNTSDYWSVYADGTDVVPIAGTNGWNYNYMYNREAWPVGTGVREQNGTFDMMGNAWEWTESPSDGFLNNLAESRACRGGCYVNVVAHLSSGGRDNNNAITLENFGLGFRVVALFASHPSLSVTDAALGDSGLVMEWGPVFGGYSYSINVSTNLLSGFTQMVTGVESPQNCYTGVVDGVQGFYMIDVQPK